MPFKNFGEKSYATEILNFLPKPIENVLIKIFLYIKKSVTDLQIAPIHTFLKNDIFTKILL